MEQLALQSYDQSLAELGRRWQELPQVECPVAEQFSDGCYLRSIIMPAGTAVVGAKHKTRHFNIISRGLVKVMMDGEIELIDAREKHVIFESQPGVRKVLHILEETHWITIHPTHERDMEKLGELLVENYQEHELYLARIELQKLHDHDALPQAA